jgi:hypothetical protein
MPYPSWEALVVYMIGGFSMMVTLTRTYSFPFERRKVVLQPMRIDEFESAIIIIIKKRSYSPDPSKIHGHLP